MTDLATSLDVSIPEDSEPMHPDVAAYNALPRIIHETGMYRTRNGTRVMIHSINPKPEMISNGNAAKGMVEKLFRGVMRFKGLEIWHVNGRRFFLKESGLDIVEMISQ